MERDFMGLSVKQEIDDDEEPVIDAAPVRSLAMQWSFSNKASPIPQLVAYQGSQDHNKFKTGFDSLASTGLVTITTTENFDTNRKSYENNTVQGGVGYKPNLAVLPAIGGAVYQSFVAATRQNLIGSSTPKPPVTNPGQIKHFSSPVVGTTDLRNGSKVSGAPAQLTLFYNGSVCVYDNISADKAQAIMLLAGNGPSSIPITQPPVQTSMHHIRPSVLESFAVSHPYTTTAQARPGSRIVTSINGSQYTARPVTNNDTTIITPAGIVISSNKAEPINLPGYVSSSTVPQFRRKSLARFLEKRKERVISSSSPYIKQSPESSIHASSLSINSSS